MKRNHNHSLTMEMPVSRGHSRKTDVEANGRRIGVELTCDAPQAERVFVAGNFNHWCAGTSVSVGTKQEAGRFRFGWRLAGMSTGSSLTASGRTTLTPQPVFRTSLAPATVCSW